MNEILIKLSFYKLDLHLRDSTPEIFEKYYFNNLRDIKKVLKEHFSVSDGLQLILCREDVLLSIYHNGELIEKIDLHPYITITIQDYPEITFSEKNELIGIDMNDEIVVEKIQNLINYGEIKFKIRVDWDSISIPDLTGNIMRNDQQFSDKWD